MFLLISSSTIYGSNFNLSYGQISLVPDNSLIAQTTDCITSMMTSALIGVNSDCTDNISKINSTDPDSTTSVSSSNKDPDSTTSVSSSNNNPYNLSKNNPFYHEFQTKDNTNSNDNTPSFVSDSSNPINSNHISTFTSPPQDNPSTFLKSPPQDNPSTISGLQQPQSPQEQQRINQPVSNPYSFQSLHTTINKNSYTTISPAQSDLGNSIDGKNKHSKEISACFDRAFSIDNYLSDSEIIECAKDRDSYSQKSINYILSDKLDNSDNDDNDGNTDNKHSKEISACFDRAFSIDNYLSDSEIIECAKDRDSFK